MGTFFNSNYFASTSHTDAFGLRIKSHAPPFIFPLLILAMINEGDGGDENDDVADDDGDDDNDNSDCAVVMTMMAMVVARV